MTLMCQSLGMKARMCAGFRCDEYNDTPGAGYFMQPWTLMSPGSMGQFPAAALVYRQGLVSPGPVSAADHGLPIRRIR